jgi:hypothetical protein
MKRSGCPCESRAGFFAAGLSEVRVMAITNLVAALPVHWAPVLFVRVVNGDSPGKKVPGQLDGRD